MKNPMSRDNVKKQQAKLVDSMVDIDVFRHIECSQCKKDMGPVGVRGVGFQTNAQHMGDIVVELQCPHCDSGYSQHYRRVASSLSYFAKLLLCNCLVQERGTNLALSNPVNSFDIQPQDNNLLTAIQEDMAIKKGKKEKT